MSGHGVESKHCRLADIHRKAACFLSLTSTLLYCRDNRLRRSFAIYSGLGASRNSQADGKIAGPGFRRPLPAWSSVSSSRWQPGAELPPCGHQRHADGKANGRTGQWNVSDLGANCPVARTPGQRSLTPGRGKAARPATGGRSSRIPSGGRRAQTSSTAMAGNKGTVTDAAMPGDYLGAWLGPAPETTDAHASLVAGREPRPLSAAALTARGDAR